jgi:serine/threonine-protein kinase RsbW
VKITSSHQFGTLAARERFAMPDDPIITMTMASEDENVLLVREALVGMAQALDLDALTIEDVLTAVTEACNNVVLHAYPRGTGPLQFELRARDDAIEAIVRDHGVGIRPRLRSSRSQIAGIGIPVIQSLAQRVQFGRPASDGGTEVRMEFDTVSTDAFDALADGVAAVPIPYRPDPASVAVTLAPARLLEAMLPRLLGVLGAKADFSTNRLSDVHMLADALAAHAPGALEVDGLALVATAAPRSLELCVGPLTPSGGEQLLGAAEIPSLGSIIERLTDRNSMSHLDGKPGMLTLQLNDRR